MKENSKRQGNNSPRSEKLFWKIFRIILVVFMLYLLGDILWRWNGFKYYAPFSEYIPNVALITVLWACVAVFAALIIWAPLSLFKRYCLMKGLNIKVEQGMLFIASFSLFGGIIWFIKRSLMQYSMPLQNKILIFLFLLILSLLVTYVFRNKVKKWMDFTHNHITPLVWLFIIFSILAVPVAAYHALKERKWVEVAERPVNFYTLEKSRQNIILITFDALTVRDMSAYGYYRPTTPFIEEWAKKGSFFANLKAAGNITLPTTISLMTGKRMWTHQAYANIEGASGPIMGNTENLGSVLKKNGYYTMAFIANTMASTFMLNITEGFDIQYNPNHFIAPLSISSIIEHVLLELFSDKFRLYNWVIKDDFVFKWIINLATPELLRTEYPPDMAFNSFLTSVDRTSQMPFFAWIHLMPPHAPYLPPEPYLGTFAPYPTGDKKQWKNWEYKRARYDEFIIYCDDKFKEFMRQFEKNDKFKNTVIILSSDHGESFEHGILGHGSINLYEQPTHIPLIIAEPDQTRGRVINDLVSQIDIPATILDLANISVPSWMEGRSLVPLLRGEKILPEPVFSMVLYSNPRLHQINKGTIAVWLDNYKLVHYLDKRKSLLFNLQEDPDELNNLFDFDYEKGQYLLSIIHSNLNKANKKISDYNVN